MNNRLKTMCVSCILFCFALTLQAKDKQKEAESFYMSGDYVRAAAVYEEMLKEGEAPELYYNLGNAYYKSNLMGKSILNYERALRIKPSFVDAKFNLQLANQQIQDKIEPVEVFFLTQWIQSLRALVTSNGWGLLSVVFFSLCLLFALLYAFGRYRWMRKTGFFSALFFLLFSIVTFTFSYQQKKQMEQHAASVIMTGSVTVKSSPDESGTELFILHEGTKVSIKSTLGKWSEIKIADGNVGWIKTSDLERI